MVADIIFKIGEATASVVAIIGFCILLLQKDTNTAGIFLLGSFVFIGILMLIEQQIFNYNCQHNYDHMPRY